MKRTGQLSCKTSHFLDLSDCSLIVAISCNLGVKSKSLIGFRLNTWSEYCRGIAMCFILYHITSHQGHIMSPISDPKIDHWLKVVPAWFFSCKNIPSYKYYSFTSNSNCIIDDHSLIISLGITEWWFFSFYDFCFFLIASFSLPLLFGYFEYGLY